VLCKGGERCRGGLGAIYEQQPAKPEPQPTSMLPAWFADLPQPITASNGHNHMAGAR
jgi:hypothetical protein